MNASSDDSKLITNQKYLVSSFIFICTAMNIDFAMLAVLIGSSATRYAKIDSPDRIRTDVRGSKARGPWPLDDGAEQYNHCIKHI